MINDRRRLTLEMTPSGAFRAAPRVPLAYRIAIGAAAVAVVAGGLAISALVLGFALLMLPVALAAVVVAYGVIRFELWRARRSQSSARTVTRI